jgi:ferric-dicitrate binding protein FerR (iron transport regulator)
MPEKKMDRRQNLDPQEAGAENTSAREAPRGEDRRKVLRKILIAGGIAAGAAMLPDKWTKPVVDETAVAGTTSATTTPPPPP